MTTFECSRSEWPEALGCVARTLFRAGGIEATLPLVVSLAKSSLGGESVGALLIDGVPAPVTRSSDPVAARIEELQFALGEGPTSEVIARGEALYVGELDNEIRWPSFTPRAAELGIRSVLALRMAAGETIGALTLYGRLPRAFGATVRAGALNFASVAAHALSVAHVRDQAADRLEDLQRALTTRELIGQAQGILMERERITAEQAFDVLRVASQRLNVKLFEVAHRLVETGESPLAGRLLPSAYRA